MGQYIGPITDKVATVEGELFAVDKSSIILTNFTHDGSDPGRKNIILRMYILTLVFMKEPLYMRVL